MEVPKTTQLPKSAEIIASIDDLLTEILLRLPIKSLLRFKIVSKHWLSLITNPRFCRRHGNPDPNPAVGLFLPRTDNNPLFEYLPFISPINSTIPIPFSPNKFIKDPSGIRILQSCNGLLLCSSSRDNKNTKYYVYNPTTNHFSTLPKLNRAIGVSARMIGMSVAFDPAKSPHYKIIYVRYSGVTDSADHLFQIEIYSSETGAWRFIGEPFTAQVDFEDGVYWNGAVHWVTNGDLDSLYFSIRDEVVKKMPDLQMLESEYYFGESCDHLHYIERGRSELQFDVYEMKRDYSEWFVKYHVDLSLVVAANPRMIGPSDYYEDENNYDVSVYSLVRDAKEENSFLVLRIHEKVIRYNLVSETFEMLREYEDADAVGASRLPATKGIQYIESLCSV